MHAPGSRFYFVDIHIGTVRQQGTKLNTQVVAKGAYLTHGLFHIVTGHMSKLLQVIIRTLQFARALLVNIRKRPDPFYNTSLFIPRGFTLNRIPAVAVVFPL
jgi:hypothetical protein